MTKPIDPITDSVGDNYLVDAILDKDTPMPPAVQADLRHLLVACELGDLVVIQCTDTLTNKPVYVLGAHVLSHSKLSKLLPICELGDCDMLLSRIRPPASINPTVFARPTFSGKYVCDIVEHPDGTVVMSEPKPDNNVH